VYHDCHRVGSTHEFAFREREREKERKSERARGLGGGLGGKRGGERDPAPDDGALAAGEGAGLGVPASLFLSFSLSIPELALPVPPGISPPPLLPPPPPPPPPSIGVGFWADDAGTRGLNLCSFI
jgi:hypothetical protein